MRLIRKTGIHGEVGPASGGSRSKRLNDAIESDKARHLFRGNSNMIAKQCDHMFLAIPKVTAQRSDGNTAAATQKFVECPGDRPSSRFNMAEALHE